MPSTIREIWILEADQYSQSIYLQLLNPRYNLKLFSEIGSLTEALEARESSPHLIIADLKATDGSFLYFLADERKLSYLRDIPFIIVSELDDIDAMRFCFDQGARDYIVKPFGANEIRCKLERFMRDSDAAGVQTPPKAPTVPGEALPFELDSMSLTVRKSGKISAQLTSKEFQIMSIFARAPAMALSRNEIKARLWGGVKVNEKALDVHIGKLRRKIAQLDLEIRYVPPGVYKVSSQPEESRLEPTQESPGGEASP